jgi:hypothetical protein
VKPLFLTVPNTGSMFFLGVLERGLGCSHAHIGRAGPDKIAFAHCGEPGADAIGGRPIVTTVRNPLMTAVSWYARGCLDWDRFESAWLHWSEIVDRAVAVLSVDHGQSARMDTLRAAFGVDFPEPEWSRRVASDRHNSLAHYLAERGSVEIWDLIDRGRLLRLVDSLKRWLPAYEWPGTRACRFQAAG